MPLVRRCFAVDLHGDPERIAAYRKWHEPGGPPAAVNAAIRADGVESLEIWWVGDRLFMVMEQNSDAAPDPTAKQTRDAANPDVAAWDALMAGFQKSLPFASDQTWVEMERIYALSEQP
ncbi:L-rhamnose mutarotase [Sphingomonas sp. LT1P40]|uniref:L-rhamnose mutarotase n=1 Tax=Alteristakelama amylovorans TaxID=3096166 RepID=UPI002FC709E1